LAGCYENRNLTITAATGIRELPPTIPPAIVFSTSSTQHIAIIPNKTQTASMYTTTEHHDDVDHFDEQQHRFSPALSIDINSTLFNKTLDARKSDTITIRTPPLSLKFSRFNCIDDAAAADIRTETAIRSVHNKNRLLNLINQITMHNNIRKPKAVMW
jgi:hypothetical protein